MAEGSLPPPSRTLLAAAAGGFGGALLGVVAASALMGNDGDGAGGQAANEAMDTQAVEVVVAER